MGSRDRVRAHIQRIATATFDCDVHDAFIAFAHDMLDDSRSRALFLRMAERCGIGARSSALSVNRATSQDHMDAYSFYKRGSFPTTAKRMALYQQFAPVLLRRALDRLALTAAERRCIRHVIVTSCTGFYAPGLDFEAVDHLQLDASVERTTIGFMGCYAAINGLKQAHHIIRSEPEDAVLVINLELCTLHLQETQNLNEVLSFLLFGDGCAATLVSAQPSGLAIEGFRSVRIPGTADLITWGIGDQGFDMVLSGQVPACIAAALGTPECGLAEEGVRHWAVHPGGRSVLDAVEQALCLPEEALAHSRSVLRDFGNMSSATVMFVMQRMLEACLPAGEAGCAMAFGPGLTAETMRWTATGVAGGL